MRLQQLVARFEFLPFVFILFFLGVVTISFLIFLKSAGQHYSSLPIRKGRNMLSYFPRLFPIRKGIGLLYPQKSSIKSLPLV